MKLLAHLFCLSFAFHSVCSDLTNQPDIRYKYVVPEQLEDGLAVSSLESAGISPAYLEELTNQINVDTYKNIHGLIIVKNNQLVYENYFHGYERTRLHNLYSASKSVNSALIGIAHDKGLIKDLDQKVVAYFPEYLPLANADPRKQEITIKHLLTMSSGLECNDWNSNSRGQEEKAYKEDDVVKFTLDLPMVSNSGKNATYCSGGVIMLANIISKVAGEPHATFADRNLLAPLGITHYKWGFREKRQDRPDQIFLEPRDMAKFGMLFLNGGKWQGKQIISEEWVNASTQKQINLQGFDYGYLWWRHTFKLNSQSIETFSAQGNGGQFIFVFPSLQMIAVMTGGNINSPLTSQPFDILAKYILPATL